MWPCSPSAWEAEHALGNDVALDLRRAGVDRLGLGPHPAVLPAPVFDRELRFGRESAVHALDADRRLLQALVHLAPVELGQTGLWSWRVAVLGAGQVAQADEPEDMGFDPGLRDALAHRGVCPGAAVAGQGGELGDRPLEPRGLGQPAALEAEDRHRHPPAVSWLTDQVSVLDLGAGEKDLAELAAAGHLLDPPDLDARLMHVDEEEADSLVRFGVGIGAREQKALVGVVRSARPGLLAVEHPFAIAAF